MWDRWKEASVPKSSSIRPVISMQNRIVTDGQTDTGRHQIRRWLALRRAVETIWTQSLTQTDTHRTAASRPLHKVIGTICCLAVLILRAWIYMNIFNGKNHRTRRAIRPLTLALIQQNICKGKYRPSNLIQLLFHYSDVSDWHRLNSLFYSSICLMPWEPRMTPIALATPLYM